MFENFRNIVYDVFKCCENNESFLLNSNWVQSDNSQIDYDDEDEMIENLDNTGIDD